MSAQARNNAWANGIAIHRGKRIQREQLNRLTLHFFQHDIHHRGQAHAMLSGASVAPPQLDEFYASEEALLQRAEFGRLGYSETDLWRDTAA